MTALAALNVLLLLGLCLHVCATLGEDVAAAKSPLRLGDGSSGSVKDFLLRAGDNADALASGDGVESIDGSYRPPTTSYVIVCNGETCTETARFVYDPNSASWMPVSAPWLMLPAGGGDRTAVGARPKLLFAWQLTVLFLVVFSAVALSLLAFWRYGTKSVHSKLRGGTVVGPTGGGEGRDTNGAGSSVLTTAEGAEMATGRSGSSARVNSHSHSVEAQDEGGYVRVGRLLISQKVLGYGSMGTVVLEGLTEDGRRVAVKRMLSTFYQVAHAEIALLCESDEHPSVVRYHLKEDDGDFFYLALELCEKSLSEAVEAGTVFSLRDARRIILELLSGVSHLHRLKIVHRDLKPQNILLSSSAPVHLKISDMGVAKKLDSGRLSFSTQSFGSQGWQAPEVLVGGRLTEKVDIFAAGCLVFYILSGGMHLFGDRYERELNVVKGRPLEFVRLPCFSLDSDGSQSTSADVAAASINMKLPRVSSSALLPEARDLILQMVDPAPEKRPLAEECCNHLFFWSDGRRLMFLQELSDFVEYAQSSASDAVASAAESGVSRDDCLAGMSPVARKLIDALEVHAGVLFGQNGVCDWKLSLDAELLDDLSRFRRGGYNGRSVCDLLRVVRNKSRHFRQLPGSLQSCFEGSTAGLLSYFVTRFPLLLVCAFRITYLVVHDDRLRSPVLAREYAGCSAAGDVKALEAVLASDSDRDSGFPGDR